MSSLERIGGEEPTLDIQLAALGVNKNAAVSSSNAKLAGDTVVRSLQDQTWERYQRDVLAPRAEVWNSAIELTAVEPYHHMQSYSSPDEVSGLHTVGFYWRFGHQDTQKELEVTTDIGVYVDGYELQKTDNPAHKELSHAYLSLCYEGIRKRSLRLGVGLKSVLGVKPSEGMWGAGYPPRDELHEAFSKEVVHHGFALSAQVYARPFGHEQRIPLEGAATAVQFSDQTAVRPPILEPMAIKNIIRDRPDVTIAELQATIDQAMAADYGSRKRIDPLFQRLAGVIDLLGRNDSKPMSTPDGYDFLPRQ